MTEQELRRLVALLAASSRVVSIRALAQRMILPPARVRSLLDAAVKNDLLVVEFHGSGRSASHYGLHPKFVAELAGTFIADLLAHYEKHKKTVSEAEQVKRSAHYEAGPAQESNLCYVVKESIFKDRFLEGELSFERASSPLLSAFERARLLSDDPRDRDDDEPSPPPLKGSAPSRLDATNPRASRW